MNSTNGRIIQNVRAAKTTAFMVGALLVCYLPLIIKWHLCDLNSFIFALLAQTAVATNSFMNPFIYALKVPAFRSVLKSYITTWTQNAGDTGHTNSRERGLEEDAF